jgi:hypothetical protein
MIDKSHEKGKNGKNLLDKIEKFRKLLILFAVIHFNAIILVADLSFEHC